MLGLGLVVRVDSLHRLQRMDEMTQKGNSAGGCDMVAGARRAEERPWGGARESLSTENSQRSDWKREMLVWKKNEKSW